MYFKNYFHAFWKPVHDTSIVNITKFSDYWIFGLHSRKKTWTESDKVYFSFLQSLHYWHHSLRSLKLDSNYLPSYLNLSTFKICTVRTVVHWGFHWCLWGIFLFSSGTSSNRTLAIWECSAVSIDFARSAMSSVKARQSTLSPFCLYIMQITRHVYYTLTCSQTRNNSISVCDIQVMVSFKLT